MIIFNCSLYFKEEEEEAEEEEEEKKEKKHIWLFQLFQVHDFSAFPIENKNEKSFLCF